VSLARLPPHGVLLVRPQALPGVWLARLPVHGVRLAQLPP